MYQIVGSDNRDRGTAHQSLCWKAALDGQAQPK